MAIYIPELKLPITHNEALNIINRHTAKMGVFLDLDRIYEIIAILQLENRSIARELRSICNRPGLDVNNKDTIAGVMIELGVNPRDFVVNGTPAFNKDTRAAILSDESLSEETRAFVEKYTTFASNKTRLGTLNGYTKLPVCKVLSWNGHRMVLARPNYHLLSTSRIQAYDPAIQGIARTFGDVVTYPSGYILIRCDSSQIEPRINFSYFVRDELVIKLITYYDDAYFGILHFAIMPDGLIQECRDNFDECFVPIVITDEMKDNRQNTKTLVNAGSYGSSHLSNVNASLAAAFDKRIVHHPARLALEREVDEICSHNPEPTFYSAFGTPITPDETAKYSKGTKAWKGHLLRCGVNNPVQTTASDLMICSVNEANRLLMNAPNSAICYYKHDEGAFLVHEDDAERNPGLVDSLSDVTAYNVEGWIPIPSEAVIGMKKPTLESYL